MENYRKTRSGYSQQDLVHHLLTNWDIVEYGSKGLPYVLDTLKQVGIRICDETGEMVKGHVPAKSTNMSDTNDLSQKGIETLTQFYREFDNEDLESLSESKSTMAYLREIACIVESHIDLGPNMGKPQSKRQRSNVFDASIAERSGIEERVLVIVKVILLNQRTQSLDPKNELWANVIPWDKWDPSLKLLLIFIEMMKMLPMYGLPTACANSTTPESTVELEYSGDKFQLFHARDIMALEEIFHQLCRMTSSDNNRFDVILSAIRHIQRNCNLDASDIDMMNDFVRCSRTYLWKSEVFTQLKLKSAPPIREDFLEPTTIHDAILQLIAQPKYNLPYGVSNLFLCDLFGITYEDLEPVISHMIRSGRLKKSYIPLYSNNHPVLFYSPMGQSAMEFQPNASNSLPIGEEESTTGGDNGNPETNSVPVAQQPDGESDPSSGVNTNDLAASCGTSFNGRDKPSSCGDPVDQSEMAYSQHNQTDSPPLGQEGENTSQDHDAASNTCGDPANQSAAYSQSNPSDSQDSLHIGQAASTTCGDPDLAHQSALAHSEPIDDPLDFDVSNGGELNDTSDNVMDDSIDSIDVPLKANLEMTLTPGILLMFLVKLAESSGAIVVENDTDLNERKDELSIIIAEMLQCELLTKHSANGLDAYCFPDELMEKHKLYKDSYKPKTNPHQMLFKTLLVQVYWFRLCYSKSYATCEDVGKQKSSLTQSENKFFVRYFGLLARTFLTGEANLMLDIALRI